METAIFIEGGLRWVLFAERSIALERLDVAACGSSKVYNLSQGWLSPAFLCVTRKRGNRITLFHCPFLHTLIVFVVFFRVIPDNKSRCIKLKQLDLEKCIHAPLLLILRCGVEKRTRVWRWMRSFGASFGFFFLFFSFVSFFFSFFF